MKKSTFCIGLGLLLILAAGVWAFLNQMEDDRAGERAEALVQVLAAQVAELPPAEPLPPVLPDPPAMTEVELDGNLYIGYLSIPSRNIDLPILSGWDEEKLKISPCRYFGSTYTDDLVIMGHNYKRHFGPIRRLVPGDEVYLTDMDGRVHSYRVAAVETLTGQAVADMTAGEYDLTLFTCTYGGKDRITIRCDRVESIEN